jgi:hypothetical protein
MCADEVVVRKALIHEFMHCFYYVVQIIEAIDRGDKNLELVSRDIFDAKEDARRMEQPGDWLSEADAPLLTFHDDPVFAPIQDRFAELRSFFPVGVPDLAMFRLTRIGIDRQLAAHAEELIRHRRMGA